MIDSSYEMLGFQRKWISDATEIKVNFKTTKISVGTKLSLTVD